MRRVLTEDCVVTSFICFPQIGLIYLRNPKVACTTIQYNLVKAANAKDGVKKKILPHRRDEGQYVFDIFNHPLFGSQELRGMTYFSVVRNPFMRILSGYLGKIAKKTPVWRQFAAEHGLDPDAAENEMTFIDFLRIIDLDCDETMNAHFKPQYLNLLMPFSRPHFIGRLEEFAEVEKFLAGRGVANLQRKGVATNTSARLDEFYTAEAEAIVGRKFADDFKLFGYSPRLSEVRVLLEPQWRADGPDLLMRWLAERSFPGDQLDPASRAYMQFSVEKDRGKRMEIVRGILESDDNTKRLRNYARAAKRLGEETLSRAVDQRLEALKSSWRDRVDMRVVRAKKTGDTRSERRARRLERRKTRGRAGTRVEA